MRAESSRNIGRLSLNPVFVDDIVNLDHQHMADLHNAHYKVEPFGARVRGLMRLAFWPWSLNQSLPTTACY